MSQPMQILADEHGRIRAMLTCFETQLGRFERAETPDYEILGGSIAYCQEYLDRWHHPREDALFELLARRAPATAKTCADLNDQHADLARTTAELVAIFDMVQHDAFYERASLVNMGRALVSEYRQHLDWEEVNFFPAIANSLSPEDWAEIAPRFAQSNDPLAQNSVDQRYRPLFMAIADA